jgi:hypothetical protein
MALVGFFVSFSELFIGSVAYSGLAVEARFFARRQGLHALLNDFPLHSRSFFHNTILTCESHMFKSRASRVCCPIGLSRLYNCGGNRLSVNYIIAIRFFLAPFDFLFISCQK